MSGEPELIDAPLASHAKDRARDLLCRTRNNVHHYNSQFDYLSGDTRTVVGPLIEAHNQLAGDLAWALMVLERLLPEEAEL